MMKATGYPEKSRYPKRREHQDRQKVDDDVDELLLIADPNGNSNQTER